ncbi:MAG: tRNA(Ile)(2)-agmatinylcytidine synthase [Candidatus Caldarchaeum sp.]
MRVLRIGVDDTDSPNGMCTTYVGAVLERKLLEMGCEKIDYSHLVRLNPNCPFKTRGNAAVSLHIKTSEDNVDKVVKTVVETVEALYEKGYENTQPGIVIYEGVEIPDEWRRFAEKAVVDIVSLKEALDLAEKYTAMVYMFNGGRGVIGALAAVALPLEHYTFEAIAYRVRENWGTVRRIDPASVQELYLSGLSFDSYDPEKKEIRVTPHTPCPVLAGVRATSAEKALKGLSMLRFFEEVAMQTVYKTNQATDMHYVKVKLSELRPFINAVVEARVLNVPEMKRGGHVFFEVGDDTGSVTCAAYAPTGKLRNAALALRPGDVVTVMGAVKPKPQGLTLNIEKLEVKQLITVTIKRPPQCPNCYRRMESAGKNQGYRCRRCDISLPKEAAETIILPRGVSPGVYEVAISARRHLSMPLSLSTCFQV